MITLKVGIPTNGVSPVISRLVNALDQARILDEAGAIALYNLQQRFLAETAPDGSRWTPSRAGLARRARGGTGTLFDTGNLFRSIQLARTSLTESEIFTDVEYAADLQGPPVPRIFMGFAARDLTDIERMLVRRVEEALS